MASLSPSPRMKVITSLGQPPPWAKARTRGRRRRNLGLKVGSAGAVVEDRLEHDLKMELVVESGEADVEAPVG